MINKTAMVAAMGVVSVWVTGRATVVSKLTMTDSEVVSVDAAVASVTSELESYLLLKEEQRTTLKALLNEKEVFTPILTGSGKSPTMAYISLIWTVEVSLL